MKYANVVWDWNGTLLDDVDISVATINMMLQQRGLPTISLERYRDIFDFPVKDYYEKLGFNFQQDDWEKVALDFVAIYNRLVVDTRLTAGVKSVLGAIYQTGIRQYMLSALEESALGNILTRFGIRDYFVGICGSTNIYAEGKVSRGEKMLRDYAIDPCRTLMIGDSIHDAQVAKALGFDCCLFAGGHNSYVRLRAEAFTIKQMSDILLLLEL